MRYESGDFQGITPAVDPRRSDKLYAIGGRNYVLDVFGPRSVFGNRFLTPYPLSLPQHTQGCRLHLRDGDRVFTFTGKAILEWKEAAGQWKIIYVIPDTTIQPYRWTYGYLNGIMFFCHPATGILAYNLDSDVCLPLTSPGTPQEAIAIAVVSGRLGVIDPVYFTWSGPNNGLDFTPKLGGAGFQKIGERVAGDPIMVNSTAGGALIWTTGGTMRSEFTGDNAVFRHRAVNTEYRPINSFCTLQMDDNTVAFLDERGLFQSQGQNPQPLTPLFNEFLIEYLQANKLKLGQNVRLEWDNLKRRIYLSLSLSIYNPIYEKAFVLYAPIDKWGTFDEEHHGILPFLIEGTARESDYFGFIDSNGYARYWNQSGGREIHPTDATLDAIYQSFQVPAHQSNDGDAIVLGSAGVVNTVNTADYGKPSGFYNAESYGAATANLTGLDSVVQLGNIRIRSEQKQDQMVEMVNCFVGNIVSGEENKQGEDFNLIPSGVSDEDFNVIDGTEDFGIGDVNYVNHGLRIIGTLDGKSFYQEVIPELINFQKSGRYYSGSVVGVWLIAELSATLVGEAYHVKALEFEMVDAGRLN